MKKALIAAASLAAFATVVPAAAQAQGTLDNTGAYANLNLGLFDGGQADLKAVQGRLGYRFNDWIGVVGASTTTVGSNGVTGPRKAPSSSSPTVGGAGGASAPPCRTEAAAATASSPP